MPRFVPWPLKPQSCTSFILLPLTFLFTGIICQEDLPPYEDPRTILQGTAEGSYFFTQTQNSIQVRMTIRNGYDETLEGEASLSGAGTITLLKDTSIHRTFAWAVSTMVGSPQYNPATRILTLDPGEEIQFVYTWNYMDDSGNDVRQSVFVYRSDAGCTLRVISHPETFLLSNRIKIFESLADMTIPEREFQICHISTWIDPRVCSPVFPATACSTP